MAPSTDVLPARRRGSRRRSAPIGCLLALVVLACAPGCGSSPPSPGEIAEDYVTAIADGNYSNACALLDRRARERLRGSMRSSAGCAPLLRRCLPTRATVLRRDQLQLFYANVDVRIAGPRATVRTSGTAVANRIGEVTLAKRRGRWALTSYGRAKCARAGGPRAR